VSDHSASPHLADVEIVADRRRCLGNGNCVEQAPGYFQQSDVDGRVVALRRAVAGADAESVNRAVSLCPVGAIVLRRGVSL
jgi:ferredoxin